MSYTKTDKYLYSLETFLREEYPILRAPINQESANALAKIIWDEQKHLDETNDAPQVFIGRDFPDRPLFGKVFKNNKTRAIYNKMTHSIYAKADDSGQMMIDTLFHELAHALRNVHDDDEAHGEEFARQHFELAEKYLLGPAMKEAGHSVEDGFVVDSFMQMFYLGKVEAA